MQRKYADPPPQFADIGRWCGFFMSLRGVALNLSWGSFEIFGKEVIPAGSFQLLTIPKIPMLAQGAVIPPNREFLAVLGDQKSGTNIEAPLDTIVQAVMIALAKSGYSGNAQIIENVLNLDGEVIYRNQKKVERRHGVSLANR